MEWAAVACEGGSDSAKLNGVESPLADVAGGKCFHWQIVFVLSAINSDVLIVPWQMQSGGIMEATLISVSKELDPHALIRIF